MNSSFDYRPLLQLVFQATTTTITKAQAFCDSTTFNLLTPLEDKLLVLGTSLQGIYAYDQLTVPDAVLRHELELFGEALTAHYKAIYAKWFVLHQCRGNPFIDKQAETRECCAEIQRQGLIMSARVTDHILELIRAETEMRTKIELFTSQLMQYIRQCRLNVDGCLGSIAVSHVEGESRRHLKLDYAYWDGDSINTIGIGDLFESRLKRDRVVFGDSDMRNDSRFAHDPLQKIADDVFGCPVKFSADFNTIEISIARV